MASNINAVRNKYDELSKLIEDFKDVIEKRQHSCILDLRKTNDHLTNWRRAKAEKHDPTKKTQNFRNFTLATYYILRRIPYQNEAHPSTKAITKIEIIWCFSIGYKLCGFVLLNLNRSAE